MNTKHPHGTISSANRARPFTEPVINYSVPKELPVSIFLNRINGIYLRKGERVIITTDGKVVPVKGNYVICDYITDIYNLDVYGRYNGKTDKWLTLLTDDIAYDINSEVISVFKVGTSLLKRTTGNANVSDTVFVREPSFKWRLKTHLGNYAKYVSHQVY